MTAEPGPLLRSAPSTKSHGPVSHDLDAGTLYSHEGVRMMVVGTEMLTALGNVLGQLLERDADQVLFHTGQAWGQGYCAQFARDFVTTLGFPDVQRMPYKLFASLCARDFSATGWGNFWLREEYGQVFVLLDAPAVLPGGPTGPLNRIQAFYAGFFSSFFSTAAGFEIASLELGRAAEEEPVRYLLASPETIEIVSEWKQAGMPLVTLLENLAALTLEPR
ncbi:MAG: hypothetical protein K1Y36_12485 [Blastocatellia bacterium]|nr:hypothetical protein [Blastocatellia bacterium]